MAEKHAPLWEKFGRDVAEAIESEARADERRKVIAELTSEGAEGIVLMQLDKLCESPMLADAERICAALASLLEEGVMPNMRTEGSGPQTGHMEGRNDRGKRMRVQPDPVREGTGGGPPAAVVAHELERAAAALRWAGAQPTIDAADQDKLDEHAHELRALADQVRAAPSVSQQEGEEAAQLAPEVAGFGSLVLDGPDGRCARSVCPGEAACARLSAPAPMRADALRKLLTSDEAVEALRESLEAWPQPFDTWCVGWHPRSKTFAIYDTRDEGCHVVEAGFADVSAAARSIACSRAREHLEAVAARLSSPNTTGPRT